MRRYAVYYAPAANSALARFGSAWLGRDASAEGAPVMPRIAGLSAQRSIAITAAPRFYGFHATLKPPFAIAAQRTADELADALDAFSRDRAAFDLPPLIVAEIGGFLALVPNAPSAKLVRFAESVVRTFEPFRAPPSNSERTRRAQAGLDARERELLDTWGYPYVLDRWRFHLTLTDRLEPAERDVIRAALGPLVAPLERAPLRVEALSLFVQTDTNQPLSEHSRYLLRGGTQPAQG